MNVSERGTGNYRPALKPCLAWAPLVSHLPRRGSNQPISTSNSTSSSREDSRAPSPSVSVCSRSTEEGEENRGRERNLGSFRLTWSRQSTGFAYSRIVCFAPADTKHPVNHPDRHLRHTPSQSLLRFEDSPRSSSPAVLINWRRDEDRGHS